MICKPLVTALAWARLASGLHIDHAHLQLKLQAIEAQTHCQVENAKLNGDIYPKRLCLRAVHELVDGAPVDVVVCMACHLSGREFVRQVDAGGERLLSPMRADLEKEREAFQKELAKVSAEKEDKMEYAVKLCTDLIGKAGLQGVRVRVAVVRAVGSERMFR